MSDELAIIQTPRFRFHIAWWRVASAWRNFCERLKWIGHKPCNLETFAKRELELAGWLEPPSFGNKKASGLRDAMYGDMMGHAVMKMIREFSDEGHSGMSAGLAISIFGKVSRFQPLTPLTGADDEWTEVFDGAYQNKRCFSVFQDADRFDGQAYHSEAVVFEDPDGSRFTNSESARPIKFPYTPATEIVKRDHAA